MIGIPKQKEQHLNPAKPYIHGQMKKESNKNIEKTTGFKYVKPPLVTAINKGALNLYRRVKNTLSDFFKNIFKKRSKKAKKKDAKVLKNGGFSLFAAFMNQSDF
jgi:hypothetical protein